jgi:HD domain
MKQHAGEGGEMVECLDDRALAAAIRSHHERWDGSGYPDRLAGEQIPIEARIISVADTFDAITSARGYRPATPHARALEVISEEAGLRHPDPYADGRAAGRVTDAHADPDSDPDLRAHADRDAHADSPAGALRRGLQRRRVDRPRLPESGAVHRGGGRALISSA